MPESMQDNFVGTIHRAGPLVDGVQRCLDCDGVLTDYRNAIVPDGMSLPSGWEEGMDVTYWGALDRGNTSAVGVHHPAIRCKTRPS